MAIIGDTDNEITRDPDRFDYLQMTKRREEELNRYDNFFGVEEIEEMDNENEDYYNGFF